MAGEWKTATVTAPAAEAWKTTDNIAAARADHNLNQEAQDEVTRLQAEIDRRGANTTDDSTKIQDELKAAQDALVATQAKIKEINEKCKQLKVEQKALEQGFDRHEQQQRQIAEKAVAQLQEQLVMSEADRMALVKKILETLHKKPMMDNWYGVMFVLGPGGYNLTVTGDNAAYYWQHLIQSAGGTGPLAAVSVVNSVIQIKQFPHYKDGMDNGSVTTTHFGPLQTFGMGGEIITFSYPDAKTGEMKPAKSQPYIADFENPMKWLDALARAIGLKENYQATVEWGERNRQIMVDAVFAFITNPGIEYHFERGLGVWKETKFSNEAELIKYLKGREKYGVIMVTPGEEGRVYYSDPGQKDNPEKAFYVQKEKVYAFDSSNETNWVCYMVDTEKHTRKEMAMGPIYRDDTKKFLNDEKIGKAWLEPGREGKQTSLTDLQNQELIVLMRAMAAGEIDQDGRVQKIYTDVRRIPFAQWQEVDLTEGQFKVFYRTADNQKAARKTWAPVNPATGNIIIYGYEAGLKELQFYTGKCRIARVEKGSTFEDIFSDNPTRKPAHIFSVPEGQDKDCPLQPGMTVTDDQRFDRPHTIKVNGKLVKVALAEEYPAAEPILAIVRGLNGTEYITREACLLYTSPSPRDS